MAQLKDSIVSGNLRVTDTTLTDTLQVTTIKAPTSSGGSTYGPGDIGQVLKSNGSSVYWTSDSNTDEKVNVTLATTSKAYLLGTTTTPTGTAVGVTSVADTGVYLGTTTGSLYATKFVGALQGNADTATTATKATQDGDGNTISSTYLKLSGGTMTGTLTAKASQYGDEYGGALNMNNSNIYGVNAIYTADVSDNAAEGIHFYRDSTHVDTLWMNGGSLLFVPNRELGTSTTAANSQKVARFTANPTTGQVVITDGTTGGIKSSGYTIAKSVPSNADFTNTWRGIQDNLTSSTNTTESLSAKQGYLLANGSARDSTKVLKTGDTMSGNLTFNNSVGIVQTQNSGSNYTRTIKWWTGGTDPGTYGPEIGQWNTGGDSTYPGRIILMPYHKSYSSGSGPWSNNAGLCIEYNHVYIDGTELSKVGHTHNYAGSATAGGAANSANKLNTNAGATNRPVYFSGGVPVQCDSPGSGSWFKGVPLIGTDGVMEIGRYIDFHMTNNTDGDFSLRLDCTGSLTAARTVTFPNASGTIALTSSNITGTAAAWTTARTLTLGGQLTGSVSVKGNANMTLNGYLDRAFIYDDQAVPDDHTWAEYAWHKFAEVTITNTWTDCVITFLVSRTYGSSAENAGILSAKLRTNGSKAYDSAQLKWLVRNYGLSNDDFVMVYTSTSGTSTKAELWCRIPGQYSGLIFTVLKEHKRQYSTDTSWTLVKTPDESGSTHGSSSYPTTGITGTIISSDGTITNSTTGTSSNVTGTVAIANGGTGATNRLAALRALTEQNVGTNAQYFLTITQNWGEGGYTSVANAKTVLGLGSAAYTASTDYLSSSTKYAGSTSAGGAANSSNVLNSNTRMDYGWNGVNYFNINGTVGNAAKVNDTPTTAWWHIMRFNHNNNSGYYTDLAIPFNATSLYYKRITAGSVQNGGWVKVLDSLNYTSYALPRNIKHIHTASGTEGTTGWVKIARITVTAAYADHPMTFTIAQRQTMQYRIHLVFGNTASVATTTISQFIITRDNSWTDTNNNPRAYIIKPSEGIFDLYIRKIEGYDHIFVVDFTKADNNEGNNYSVTWTNVHAADSEITGGTEAVKKLYLSTSGGTVNGAITVSDTGTFRTNAFGTQLIVERTDGPNMAGITFKNTSGVLGYIAANTVDGDLYHYGATDTSTMKYAILDTKNCSNYTFKVTRGSSVSTATTGYWAAMCNSTQTGSPVLPTSGKWWHVISMDWSGNDIKNWVSQLAIATQDGSGVWWRRNDTGGTTINSYSWHRLAEGNSSGAATHVATEVGDTAGARPVFYAYLGDNTRVVYNTNFTYNPSGNVLTATTFAGNIFKAGKANTTDGEIIFYRSGSGNSGEITLKAKAQSTSGTYLLPACGNGSYTLSIGMAQVGGVGNSLVISNVSGIPTGTLSFKIIFKSDAGLPIYSMIEIPNVGDDIDCGGIIQVGDYTDGQQGSLRIVMKGVVVRVTAGTTTGTKTFTATVSPTQKISGSSVSEFTRNVIMYKIYACC